MSVELARFHIYDTWHDFIAAKLVCMGEGEGLLRPKTYLGKL